MKTMHITPAIHRRVRDPKTNEVVKEDAVIVVPASSYWLRRLRMGDIVLVEEASKPVVSSNKKQKAEKVAAVKED